MYGPLSIPVPIAERSQDTLYLNIAKTLLKFSPGLTMINLSKELAKSWRELTLDEKMV